jgi:hypothetical protein
VVRLDRVDDALGLAVAPSELGGDECVRPLHLVGHRLADVVQHRGALRRLDACLELGRHDPGEVHDLERVLEDVLAVARTEPQPAEDLDELFGKGPQLASKTACSPAWRTTSSTSAFDS